MGREKAWGFDRLHFCGAKAPLFLHFMQKTKENAIGTEPAPLAEYSPQLHPQNHNRFAAGVPSETLRLHFMQPFWRSPKRFETARSKRSLRSTASFFQYAKRKCAVARKRRSRRSIPLSPLKKSLILNFDYDLIDIGIAALSLDKGISRRGAGALGGITPPRWAAAFVPPLLAPSFRRRRRPPTSANAPGSCELGVCFLPQSAAFRRRLPEVVSTKISALSRRSAPARSLLTLPLTVLK